MFKNKTFLHTFLYLILLLLPFTLCGCSSTNKEGISGDISLSKPTPDSKGDSYGATVDISGGGVYESDMPYPSTEGGYTPDDFPVDPPVNQGPVAGQITASAWNDIDNYDFWSSLFEYDEQQNPGLFSNYFIRLSKFTNQLYTLNKITVNIKSNDLPVEDLAVTISNKNYLFEAKTDVFGYAHLYLPSELNFPYSINYGEKTYELTEYTKDTIELTTEYQNTNKKHLDIMFVVDTTGSMSDELEYLKSEIKDVIESIEAEQIRLGLLFYRDHGDKYITKLFNFTADISQQINNISNQSANGGGDTPEAVDEALYEAISQADWNENYSTKLLIHVLDAPPHDDINKMIKYTSSILLAAKKGIRIIPVASSGIDKYTEFLLRTEAMYTGGTYTFITNHSGIGNSHIEATTQETVVEYLNAMLVRLINQYHTGIITEPIPYNQQQ